MANTHPKSKSVSLFRHGRLLVLLVALVVLMFLYARKNTHSLQETVARDFTLPLLNGEPFTLSQANARVIALDFWASWCAPCIAALPNLEEVHLWIQQEGRSAAIYCVNLGDTPETVSELWNRMGLTMPVVMDSQNTLGDAYEVQAIPVTVIMTDGQIEDYHLGGMSSSELKSRIDTLLARSN